LRTLSGVFIAGRRRCGERYGRSRSGTAAVYNDIQTGMKYDLMIVGIAALTLIFVVMVIITRALVASLVIIGAVLISLGAAFGLSVLVWQYMFGS
jgi:RND superfamily putative drug exporter